MIFPMRQTSVSPVVLTPSKKRPFLKVGLVKLLLSLCFRCFVWGCGCCRDKVFIGIPGWPQTHCITQSSFYVMANSLPQPAECWDYRFVPPWLANSTKIYYICILSVMIGKQFLSNSLHTLNTKGTFSGNWGMGSPIFPGLLAAFPSVTFSSGTQVHSSSLNSKLPVHELELEQQYEKVLSASYTEHLKICYSTFKH